MLQERIGATRPRLKSELKILGAGAAKLRSVKQTVKLDIPQPAPVDAVTPTSEPAAARVAEAKLRLPRASKPNLKPELLILDRSPPAFRSVPREETAEGDQPSLAERARAVLLAQRRATDAAEPIARPLVILKPEKQKPSVRAPRRAQLKAELQFARSKTADAPASDSSASVEDKPSVQSEAKWVRRPPPVEPVAIVKAAPLAASISQGPEPAAETSPPLGLPHETAPIEEPLATAPVDEAPPTPKENAPPAVVPLEAAQPEVASPRAASPEVVSHEDTLQQDAAQPVANEPSKTEATAAPVAAKVDMPASVAAEPVSTAPVSDKSANAKSEAWQSKLPFGLGRLFRK